VTITAISGTPQSAAILAGFAQPLIVEILSGGSPVQGATIGFTAPGSGATASLGAASVMTGIDGRAQITATAGSVTGAYNVTATLLSISNLQGAPAGPAGVSPSVNFALTNTPGAAFSVVAISGSNQGATVGLGFSLPLVVEVRDGSNNLIPGATVDFTAPGGTTSAALSAASATTGSDGRAQITATALTHPGSYAVVGSVTGAASSASFALTNTVGEPVAIVAISGTPQSAAILTGFAQALVVELRDSFANPVPGGQVSFTRPGSGATATLSAGSATTGSDGRAQITATAGSVTGAYNVTATGGGVAIAAALQADPSTPTPSVDFALTNTPGAAFSVALISGGGQSATVATGFAQPLVVEVRDGSNNLIPGATVEFAAPGSTTSATLSAASATTGSDGRAQITAIALTHSGSYAVTASMSGAAFSASIELTNTAGPAVAISAQSGGGQSATAGGLFSQPLVALVVDAFGNPVASAAVTFAAPPSGATAALGTASTTSNPSGLASTTVTAGTVAGSYTATAALAGGGSASFGLTNTAGPVVSMIAVSGTPQSTEVTGAFTQALVVEVHDSFGNTVPGAPIGFAAPGSGATASLSAASVTTGSDGRAQVTAIAGTVAGTYNATATAGGFGIARAQRIGPDVSTPSVAFALTNTPGAPASASVVSGGSQSTTVATPFAAPLVVEVRDSFNNLVPGATVSFTAPGGATSATLSAATATTGSDGRTQITAIALTHTGSYAVVGSVGGESSASFELTNTAGPGVMLIAISGTPQTIAILTPFPQPLVVELRDSFSNLVPGAAISFTRPGSGATAVLSAGSATTGSDGRAQITATAGSVVGTYLVTATGGGFGIAAAPQVAPSVPPPASVSFALTNTPGPAFSVVLISGGGQSATVATGFTQPLVVEVRDGSSNLVPGAIVNFAAPGGTTSATLSAATATTGSDGRAQVNATAKTHSGSYAVTASVSGAEFAAFIELTNTAGPAVAISAQSGGGQSAAAGALFSQPLVALVVDAFGNPVASAAVTFAAPAGGATAGFGTASATSDASGLASTTVTAGSVAGSYTATASLSTGAPASFGLTNTAGPVVSMIRISGTPQSATVAMDFTQPLVVEVHDSFGNAVPGAPVGFTAPGSGATADLSAGSATTGSDGRAQITATAGTVTGSYSVTASAGGIALAAPRGIQPNNSTPSVSFALTNTPGDPFSASVVSGTSQSAMVETGFALPLIVVVRDSFNNLVPGATVSFTAPSGATSATLSAATATTGSDGKTQITAIAKTHTGSYAVVGSVGGEFAALFALTNTAGPPAQLIVAGGDGQSATVDTEFSELDALVVDGDGNPVPGATVSFAAPGSGATAQLAATTAMTDGNGHAAIAAHAGTVAGSYSVTATVPGGAAPGSFALTNIAGAPAALSADPMSTPQSATVNTGFAVALIAIVVDQFGNPVPEVALAFSAGGGAVTGVVSAATALSDASGRARVTITAGTVAGQFIASATCDGVIGSAEFELTNLAGPPQQISVRGGSSQSAVVATEFGEPLSARVQDGFGNVVSGATVSFQAPASGASANLAATAVTNSKGDATVPVTAGTIAGSYAVVASVAQSAAPVSFSLSNLAGPVFSAEAGPRSTPQSARTELGFAQPLVVIVRDSFGNPVPGASVSFRAPSVGASAVLSPTETTSGETGAATTLAVAGETTGRYAVIASVAGVAAPVVFSLLNTLGEASAVIAIGGAGQHTLATTAFPAPLRLRAIDARGNPIANAAIELTVPASGPSGTLSATAPTADDQGEVSVIVTANRSPGRFVLRASVAAGSSPVEFALTVDPIPTTTVVTIPDAAPADRTLVASVAVTAALRVPTGKVELLDNGSAVATGTLDSAGTAQISFDRATPGHHMFSVRFPAQDAFATSASAAVSVEISPDDGRITGAGAEGCSATGPGRGLGCLLVLAAFALARSLRRRSAGSTRGAQRSVRSMRSVRSAVTGCVATRAMRRRSQGAQASSRSVALGVGLGLALVAALAAPAAAQPAGARAVDRLHPASADSDWFALDSVGFIGHRDVTFAMTGDFGYRPLVIYNANDTRRTDIVRDQLVLHLAGSVTLFDKFRLSGNVPVSPYQDGAAAQWNGMPLPQPTYAFGDVTVAGDIRLYGTADSELRIAAGLQLAMPTGSRTHYMSDGVFAVDGHGLVAGTVRGFEYAADVRTLLREQNTLAGARFGSELRFSAAGGMRLLDGALVVGPELGGAAPLATGLDVGHPLELGLGAHYRVNPAFRVGLGATLGLIHAIGTPKERAMLSLIWIPSS
jgi:hypothetical protein